MTEDMMTLQEVAKYLRVSENTIRRWMRDGVLKGVRVGPRVIRFKRADVEKLAGGGGDN